MVTLTVSGLSGSAMAAWLPSSCSGSTCSVTVNAAQTVTYTATTNNIAFVTSSYFPNGNLGGLSGATTACNAAAANAGLPGSYVPWLATSTSSAQASLGSARGWIRVDGTPFADTVGTSGGTTGLINGQIYYPLSMTELGSRTGSNGVYTGANVDGSYSLNNCQDWTSGNSANSGVFGDPFAGGGAWSTNGGTSCAVVSPVYCFGKDLSSPIVPPSNSGRLAFVSQGAFNPSTGLTAADQLCKAEATSASLPNSAAFLAFLPTTTASALSRFNTGGANWVRPDGVVFVTTPTTYFWPNAPLAQHADGSYTNSSFWVWSGDGYGTSAGTAANTCAGWTAGTGQGWGVVPESGSTWLNNTASHACTQAAPVYCVQN